MTQPYQVSQPTLGAPRSHRCPRSQRNGKSPEGPKKSKIAKFHWPTPRLVWKWTHFAPIINRNKRINERGRQEGVRERLERKGDQQSWLSIDPNRVGWALPGLWGTLFVGKFPPPGVGCPALHLSNDCRLFFWALLEMGYLGFFWEIPFYWVYSQ